jgi:hypothetical protein
MLESGLGRCNYCRDASFVGMTVTKNDQALQMRKANAALTTVMPTKKASPRSSTSVLIVCDR